jgi:hypothetical protein
VVASHRNPDRGRQGARDKKRVSYPRIKVCNLPGAGVGAGLPHPNKPTQNKKTQLPFKELRIETLSLDPQVGGQGVSRTPPSGLQAGLLALGSSYSRRLPEGVSLSGLQPVSSPITAAGPQRFCTVFPFNPMGPISDYYLSRFVLGVKGNRRGAEEDIGVLVYAQGAGHRGALGLE